MLEKINIKNQTEKAKEVATFAGQKLVEQASVTNDKFKLLFMGGAMLVAMSEVAGMPVPKSDHTKAITDRSKIIMPMPVQESTQFGSYNGEGPKENMRRMEETGPHHISYGTMQRTPGRSGGI